MKILAFTDIHGSITKLKKLQQKVKKNKPDIILCLGDFTLFKHHIDNILRKINTFKTPTYIIPGNHETASILKKLCQKYKNLHFAHKKIIKIKQYTLVGFGGGGFSTTDKEFEKFIKANKKKITKKKIILITHGPPYKTKLDYIDYLKEYVGCKSYTTFIKKYKPILALSGHIHETFGKKDKTGQTEIINPGANGMIIKI